MLPTPISAAARYEQLVPLRAPYIRAAQECSRLSITHLYPPDGMSPSTDLPTAYQSIGAEGVNTLSSKMMLATLPPNTAFFRLAADEQAVAKAAQQDPALPEAIEEGLAAVERIIMSDIEQAGDRHRAFHKFQHLIVAGNVATYDSDTDGLRVYSLNEYVVKRDPMGKVIEFIIKEKMDPATLPEALKQLITPTDLPSDGVSNDTKELALYTYGKRDDNKYRVHQEFKDTVIPDSESVYPVDACPFNFLRLFQVTGEDYGRGYVESYLNDLQSYNGLSRAILEGSIAAARLLVLLNPNSPITEQDIESAPNGGVVHGTGTDVEFLQVNKYNDLKTAELQIQRLEQRLQKVFLMQSSVQRNAERVTAEEIRYMAQELDDSLGGLYSMLAQEDQLPSVQYKLAKLTRLKRLPALPKGVIKPTIITGIEALGRSHEVLKWRSYLQALKETFGPEYVAQAFKTNQIARIMALGYDLDVTPALKTDDELAAEQEQAASMAQQQTVTPELIKAGGGIIQKGMDLYGKQADTANQSQAA